MCQSPDFAFNGCDNLCIMEDKSQATCKRIDQRTSCLISDVNDTVYIEAG